MTGVPITKTAHRVSSVLLIAITGVLIKVQQEVALELNVGGRKVGSRDRPVVSSIILVALQFGRAKILSEARRLDQIFLPLHSPPISNYIISFFRIWQLDFTFAPNDLHCFVRDLKIFEL